MYEKLDNDRKIIADKYIEEINSLSDSKLISAIDNLVNDLKNGYNIENDEEVREVELSVSEQQELLDAIYENIKSEEDKRIFGLAILENSKHLDHKIIENFEEKMQEFVEKDFEEADSNESEEELEEEQTKDTPDIPMDDAITIDVEELEKEEDLEEKDKQVEKPETVEGPAIAQYKKETEELKQKLAELEAQLNNPTPETVEETNELDDLIAQTSFNQTEEDKKTIEDLNNLIAKVTEEKNFWERKKQNFLDENPNYNAFEDKVREFNDFGRILNKLEEEIKKAQSDIETIKNKTNEKDGKTFNIETYKFRQLYEQEIKKLEDTYKQLEEIQNKFYEEKKGIPLEIYGMKSKIENLIPKMKNDLHEKLGIRSFFNVNDSEYRVLIDNIKECRELNNSSKEEINEKFADKVEDNTKTNSDNEELLKQIEDLKKEIGDRENNIATYYDALKDINEIGNEIKAGKTPDDEELKNKINAVKEKINPLPESLKKELEEYLNKALTKPIEKVEKQPKKWQKWVAGIAGLAVGAGIVALTPIGAGAVVLTSVGLKMGVNALHKHFVKKDAELAKENEVTKVEKPNEKQKAAAAKFKEFMKNENNIKNINWFLTGSIIGAGISTLVDGYVGLDEPHITQPTGNVEPQTTQPTDPYSEIKIGDNASKLDLSQGYDQANWAANNVNAESLNQTIMQDGNSIIDSVGIVRDGSTQVIDATGKSIAEIAQQYGVSPEEVVLNITNQQGVPRAWVDAAEAVGRVMK